MTIRDDIVELITLDDKDVIFLEPRDYDDAIIGLYWDAQDEPHIAYDKDKIIDMHIKDGMSEEEAYEYFEYNTVRALPYMGMTAPIIIDVISYQQGKEKPAIDITEVPDEHREAQEN